MTMTTTTIGGNRCHMEMTHTEMAPYINTWRARKQNDKQRKSAQSILPQLSASIAMNKESMFKIVRELDFDKNRIVFNEDNFDVYLLRPSKLSKRFKDYDVKRNFQIWLKEDERAFRPNHLRVLIDLNLRARTRPDLKENLLWAFDEIFYGSDPEEVLEKMAKEKFEHFLNPLRITGCLSQLLLIEQEYCYHKESNFDPPTLFYQGWVREFIDNPKEIDNLCMSVCNRQPPMSRYTNKENKKNKKFRKSLKPLWYIEKQKKLAT